MTEKKQNPQYRILFAASECVPFVKTGGLADVVGSLPMALHKPGMDLRVALPLYTKKIPDIYQRRMKTLCSFSVCLGWRSQPCSIRMLKKGGVTFYFFENEYYFGRDYVYGSFTPDEGERFAFFSKAILEAMPYLDFFPDILHAHDWQTGMALALLRLQYQQILDYGHIKSIFTIHNLRYQGVFPWNFISDLLSLPADCFTSDCLEYFGCANFLKAGLVYADAITTVSPAYANEIQTLTYGETLDGLLRARSAELTGILNGIDTKTYNPAKDENIAAFYSARDLSGKAACKAALQKAFALDAAPQTPIVAMVTRLTDQKGLDLVEQSLALMLEEDLQLVVLGTGEARYTQFFSWAAWRYPGRVGAQLTLDTALAHQVYAGADIFLMPSQFEPCGLAQMIALRYGTVPVVRETGGLIDSVQPYNKYTDEGIGFSFSRYAADDMLQTLCLATALYREAPEAWTRLMLRGMAANFDWKISAKKYIALYDTVLQ